MKRNVVKVVRGRNQNFLPAFVLTLVWWILLGVMVMFVDPEVVADFPITGSYFSFFAILFLGVLFLMSLLLGNTRRGLLMACWVIGVGYLRIWGLGNILNIGLLTGVIGTCEFYFLNRKKPDLTPSS